MQVFQTLKNYILWEDVSYEKKNGVTIGSCDAGHLAGAGRPKSQIDKLKNGKSGGTIPQSASLLPDSHQISLKNDVKVVNQKTTNDILGQPGGAALASDSSEVIILSDEAGIVSEEMEADSEESELSAGEPDTESAVEESAGVTEEAEAAISENEAGIALIEAIEEVSEDEIAAVSESADEAAAIAADADEPAAVSADADEPVAIATIVDNGTCGDNLTWTLSADGTLTISGTGDMEDFLSTWDQETPWDAESVKTIIIEYGVTNIASLSFYCCSNLESVTIPDSVTDIGRLAFGGDTKLTSVIIPDSVTSIGDYAFTSTGLTSIVIPDSVTDIYIDAFAGCENLTEVVLSNSITSIKSEVFASCYSLTSIVIPDGVTEIGWGAFAGCSSLSSVSIPDSVTSIDESAFSNCTSLTNIIIPDGVKTIDGYAFWGCTGMTSVTIPASVTSIGSRAFGFYRDGNTVTSIDNFIIYGYTGSAAETYAKENNLTFIALDSTTVTLATGTISKLTNSSSGIKIQWNQVSGAAGYYIYRKTGSGSYSKIKTVTSASTVSYTDTAVKKKNGTTYTYKVVPYSGSTTGTGTAKKTVRLTGTTLSSVKNSASKKATVKWKKTTKVSGYQIQYSTSKSFASGNKTTTVSGASKTSKKLTGLKKGKTYYVRVRTYKTVSGTKYYSAWSSAKKVKISK